MKRYEYSYDVSHQKLRRQRWKCEHTGGGFRCSHCKQFVVVNDHIGTANRNHCNWCLWSKHVDENKGDRRSDCKSGMRPIGLTFKHEGYGRTGEIMLVHLCLACEKISINRIARDDSEQMILAVFTNSLKLSAEQRTRFAENGIYLLDRGDEQALTIQLFGV